MHNEKWLIQSKTIILSVLGLVALYFPSAQGFIEEYFHEAGTGFLIINLVLRYFTHTAVTIKKPKGDL